MTYYYLIPADQPHDNTIFNHFVKVKGGPKLQFTTGSPLWAVGGRRWAPREMYNDLRCPACRKIDEFKALARGLDPGIRIKAKTDFVSCWEGLLCCSARAADVIRGCGAWGVDIIPLPGDPDYFLLWANPLVKTDEAKCMLRVGGKCTTCGRLESLVGELTIYAMELPEKHPCLIGSDIWRETNLGRTTALFADDPMRRAIKAARLTGICEWKKCPASPPPWFDKWKATGGRYLPPAVALNAVKGLPPFVMQMPNTNPETCTNQLIEFADASVADEIEALLADSRYKHLHDILRKALKTARGQI